MLDLAVVVVTWNTRDLTINALRSLYADLDTSGLTALVYVVDNASTDGTAEALKRLFPQVTLITNAENRGFGAANNLAMRQIMNAPDLPSAIYLLNSDTLTQMGATRALYDALLSQERAGLVGARLSYEDGSFQHSAFAFPGLSQLWVEFFPTPGRLIEGEFNGRYPRALYERGEAFPVDFVLGATMMLRPDVITQTGMFDEQFFMYCEEIDWEWRIHHAGWQVLCVPSARVTHLAGQSTQQVRPRSLINLWTSRLLLAKKHYPLWKRPLARGLIALGTLRKCIQTSDPEARAAYQTIQQMALR
ncbi:MAG: glycosyltransferase [Chloroflexi bacterium]|nr:glycosyltransferase [Chloroflexota bacterium]